MSDSKSFEEEEGKLNSAAKARQLRTAALVASWVSVIFAFITGVVAIGGLHVLLLFVLSFVVLSFVLLPFMLLALGCCTCVVALCVASLFVVVTVVTVSGII